MLILAGEFEVDPTRRDEFLAGREDMMRISRSEPGNHHYIWSADPVDPNKVFLFECWETKEALHAHMVALQSRPPAPGSDIIVSGEVLQYDIAKVGPIER